MTKLAAVLLAALIIVPSYMRAADPGAGPSEQFYRAIRENDLPKLDELIKSAPNSNVVNVVNVRSDQGITPLMDAAAFGSTDAMKRLLSAGADVNATNVLGSTALMWSVRDPEKVRLLLARGADVNAASTSGRTPLLVAALSDQSADIVKLLIARGANVRAVDKIGMTALHAATSGNDPDTVRAVVRREPCDQVPAVLLERFPVRPRSMDFCHGHWLGRERADAGARTARGDFTAGSGVVTCLRV